MHDFRVFLDLDGVIFDWMGSAMPHLGIDPNNKEHAHLIRTEHDAPDLIVGKSHVSKIIGDLGVDFWSHLKPLPWAHKLLEEMKKHGQVDILTSPGGWVDAGRGKFLAIKREFNLKSFILLKNKHVVAMPNAILIDDKPSNIVNFRKAGGWAYLWPNQFLIEDGTPKIEDVMQDLVSYISSIKSKLRERNGDSVLYNLSYDNGRKYE